MAVSEEFASNLAVNALLWIASQDDILPLFLGATGASVEDIRAAHNDPVIQIAVLDFLMTNDSWVMEFCDREEIAYTVPMEARQALPGGDQVHWT